MKIKNGIIGICALILMSCGGQSFAEVEIDSLETVCDCGDALALGLTQEMEFKKNREKYENEDGSESQEVNDWEKKMKALQKHCIGDLKFTPDEVKDCPSMLEVKKEMDKMK